MSVLNPPYQAEVYRVEPKEFSPQVEVAACYIHCNDNYLLLHSAEGKPQEFTWGVPAGKIEKEENPRQAVIREVHEETGIYLDDDYLVEVGTLYVRYPHVDFVYHMFTQKSPQQPTVHLSNEHQEYCWVNLDDLLKFPLISGAYESFQHFKALASETKIPRKPFYFLRHGETKWTTQQILNRDTDISLTAHGKKQATEVRKSVNTLPLQSICCSPLVRAKETRDIISKELSSQHYEFLNLTECSGEVWSKMIKLEQGTAYEVCSDVQGFIRQAIRGISSAIEEEGPVLVVAHGGIHWVMCYHMRLEGHPWKIGNCQLVYFEPFEKDQWKATIIS